MNQEPNSLRGDATAFERKGWQKIAVAFTLLLLLAWLYTLPTRDVQPQQLPELPGSRSVASQSEPREADSTARSVVPSRDETRSRASKGNVREQSTSAVASATAGENLAPGIIVRNVRVIDSDGRIVYRGDVNLSQTLDRIQRGDRLRFAHDGIVFDNREKRLPIQPSGYYHEYVHPTPKETGPGAQRVVIGRKGEIFYTPDHYQTFRRVR